MNAEFLLANLYSTWGLAAALAALCFLALRGNWFGQQRSKDAETSPEAVRETISAGRREKSLAASDDILRWQVEMHELARDVKGEIDAKLLALQALITLTNEHSQRLEELLRRAEQANLLSPSSAAFVGGREILDRIEHSNCNLPPLSAATQGRELLNAAQRKLIAQLAGENYSPTEIAPLVGAPVVDVEWCLSLQK